MNGLPLSAKLYLCAVIGSAIALEAFLLTVNGISESFGLIAILIALVMLPSVFPVHVSSQTKFSLHTSAIFAAVLLTEPGTAMLIAGTGMLAAQLLRRQPVDQSLFNAAQTMLQAAGGGLILSVVGWRYDALMLDLITMILAACGTAVVMYLIEVSAVAGIAALQSSAPIGKMWRQIARFDAIELVSQFVLGLFCALVLQSYIWMLPFLLPLAFVIYRSSARQAVLRQQADALAHEASHDALTRLPNRALFLDRLQHALDRSIRRQSSIGVLFLDLDRFKVINDSLGHDVGDQLLVAVADRLRDCLRPEDTLARLGGDEFTLLLEDIANVSDVTNIAERVLEALREPFYLSGYEVVVTTSIGIAISHTRSERPQTLLRSADVAMYRAKDKGKARYELYDAEMSAEALQRLQHETELRYAIARHELRVFYQPIVDMRTGSVAAFEALIRWQHPRRGLLTPAAFVPLAEETGLIVDIDRWVLETACQQMQDWQKAYPDSLPIRISVNISVREFKYSKLPDIVSSVLKRTKLEAHRLILEIPESAMLEDIQGVRATLGRLRELGVEVAIDDFGTGYSSLRYLQRFPVEVLKLDKDFVIEIRHDMGSQGIVEAVSKLAATLGMEFIAEGIETAEQFEHLQRLNCYLGQGYYFSEPLSTDDVDQLYIDGMLLPDASMIPISHEIGRASEHG